jgi:L-fuconolactonase
MVIDHIAKPLKYPRDPQKEDFENWKIGMANAAKHQNIYVKLSGIISETKNWSAEVYQPYINHLLKVFGVNR